MEAQEDAGKIRDSKFMLNLLSEPKLEEDSQEMIPFEAVEPKTDDSLEEPVFGFGGLQSPSPQLPLQDDCIMITDKNMQEEDEDEERKKDNQIAEFKNDSFVIQHDQFMTPDKPEEKGPGSQFAFAHQMDQATNTEVM